MSIHRSGLLNPVYVVCIKSFQLGELKIDKDEKFELVHDIGSMYVIKNAKGEEAVVPKDAFVDAPAREEKIDAQIPTRLQALV